MHREVGSHNQKERLGDVAVGDELLFAVQHPMVAVEFGAQARARLEVVGGRHAVVRAAVCLGLAGAQHERIVGEERLEETFPLLIGADGGDQVAPFPALAEGFRGGAVGLGQFGHHQGLGHEVDAVAASFLGHHRGAEAQLRAFLDELPVDGVRLIGNPVARQRDRIDFLLGEFSRLHLPGGLFFVQRKIHCYFLIVLSFSGWAFGQAGIRTTDIRPEPRRS